jgi:branched-chain amino acid transport system permease protein
VTTFLSALSTGAIFTLLALGFNIAFVSAGMFNFAQAQFMMVGTFVSYWLAVQLHLPVELGFVVGAVIGFALGAIEERVAIRPVLGKGAHAELITTIGVGIILDGIASVVWGTQPFAVPFFGPITPVKILGGFVQPVELIVIGLAIVVPVVMEIWSRRSMLGLACLASSEDRTAAMVRGINTRRISLIAVAAAAGFAGMLGPLVGPQTYAVYNIGDTLAITAFVAMAIGGFGSYLGSLVGGFTIGIVEQVSVRYLSAEYQDVIVFGVLVILLMLRPAGLFRSARARVV